jgi:putative zinc finger/helix-turn-helix YgiT family protein
MICDVCHSDDNSIKNYKSTYLIKGKEIELTTKRRFCNKCHNLVYDEELDNAATLKAMSLYNQKYGIEAEKIIALRKKYNLSQELFAKIIGCAKKTLISYEKGKSIPNDTYLIMLKSLIANPKMIIDVISANKEQFSSSEYSKIDNKIKLDPKEELTQYNGYTKLDNNKIDNMILFFAKEEITKTKLLKEMFYADFLFYKNYGRSITGLTYCKLPFGPVPDQFEDILFNSLNRGIINYLYSSKGKYECYNISNRKKLNDKDFTKDELDILKQVKNYFKEYSVKDIEEFSHKEKAFTETDKCQKISYDYAFDISLDD